MVLLPLISPDNCPALLRDASRYLLPHPFNVKIAFTRTFLLKNSFFHGAPKLLNTLPHQIQASTTLHAFVCRLKNYYDISVQPNRLHLYRFDIKFVAIHCMLRMGRSPLNISRSYRKCECGKTENVNHFLLHCPLYEKLRITMLVKLQSVRTNSNVRSIK